MGNATCRENKNRAGQDNVRSLERYVVLHLTRAKAPSYFKYAYQGISIAKQTNTRPAPVIEITFLVISFYWLCSLPLPPKPELKYGQISMHPRYVHFMIFLLSQCMTVAGLSSSSSSFSSSDIAEFLEPHLEMHSCDDLRKLLPHVLHNRNNTFVPTEQAYVCNVPHCVIPKA
ncbi:hypothetical protein F5Y03DRAFT_238883 [Xylaria venustula]|nr:hypothetical protein F5Y03DRAFT_238883 [Xylaria venustula]